MNDEKKETPKPKFLNRSERNAGYKTDAQIIFDGKQIITSRPEGMNRDDYRLLRKIQTETLKQLFHKGKSPSRKLQGILGNKEPIARTAKGLSRVAKRMITQRKAG